MNADPDSNAPWEPCPDGALVQMASRLSAKRRRRETVRIVMAGGVAAAAVAVALLSVGVIRSDHVKYGGITCAECQRQFVPYHAFQTGGENEFPIGGITIDNMRMHLADCGICRGKFEAAYPGILELTAAFPHYCPPALALAMHPPLD